MSFRIRIQFRQACSVFFLHIGLMSFLSSCSDGSAEDPFLQDLPFDVVLTPEIALLKVDSSEVRAEEIQLTAQLQIDKLVMRFSGLNGSDADRDIWFQETGGERPIDQLRRLTLLESVESRFKLDLAEQMGLRADTSFESFHRRWQVENINRLEAAAKGEQLYGPVQYSFAEFYSLDLRSLDLLLMQRLEEKDLLKEFESFWDPHRGESRHERMERLFKKYIYSKLAETPVWLNHTAFKQIDLLKDFGS